jgi:hypothetical protein
MITITRALAFNYLDDPILDEPTGERFRWSYGRRIIFLHTDGKHYEASYQMGTGDEGERPWEHDKTVDCHEVHQLEKRVLVWERVDKDA